MKYCNFVLVISKSKQLKTHTSKNKMEKQQRRQVHRMNSLQHDLPNRQQADMKKIVENYQFWLGNVIMKNQFSQVYSGVQKNTQRPVAIKVIPIQKSLTSKQQLDMQNQIKLCRTIPKHKNIISVYDTFSTSNNYYIMMEKTQVDVKALLIRKKILTQEQVIPIILDVLEGLRCLNLNGILHCNIKHSNILIGEDGSAKITDFALMRNMKQQQKVPAFEPNQWTPYMHHLTLLTKVYDQNNDLWSLAVTVYELLHGYHSFPWRFQNYSDLLQKVYLNDIKYSKNVSIQMAQFLGRILNPKNKISILDVYNDPFIKNHFNKRTFTKNVAQDFPQPRIFRNFSIDGNNYKNVSIENQSEQDPFLKYNAELQQKNNQLGKMANNYKNIDLNNKAINQVKRHVSTHETSSSPQKIGLKHQNTNVQNNQQKISVRQILDCQLSFMRFINIILKQDQNGYVPEKRDINLDQKTRQIQQKRQIDHLLFRFIMIKQVLGQKDWLKKTLDVYHPQNPFSIEKIDEFLKNYENKEVIKNFRKFLDEYDRKYFELEEEMKRLIVEISERLSKIKNIWRPRDILTPDLQRKQIIPILGVRLSREMCKHVWYQIKHGYSLLQRINPINERQMNQRNAIIAQMQEKARRVDFLMTYYILNCLLIDNFSSPEYFVKRSGLSVIMNNKPTKLQFEDFSLVEQKLKRLEFI